MFYSLLIDKSKSITVIWIYKELEKEVRYIDNDDIMFTSNRVDDLLL